ncbi:MAG: 4Fe-4S binding protein [Chitinispirillia bacterium]|nr:4Fe-4S binding protein [Chitinispirillia bacterium]
MMKNVRVIAAAFFMAALSLLFLDYTGTVHSYLGWSAKLQLVPAILAGSIAVIAGLLLLTLIFGRIYCSAICPLGIFQDVISRVANISRKNRFSYRPPRKSFFILRFAILGLFVFAMIASVPVVTVLIEPYSAYGRMISQLFGPLYQWGNNILAHFAERADSYAFYSVDVWLKSVSALVAAGLTFVAASIFAWKSGRGYCNTLCPVGALLGLASQLCLMKPPVWEKCSGCGLCAKKCKSGCIDTVNKRVDYLRCVSCFNCYGACPQKVFSVSWGNPFGVKKSTEQPIQKSKIEKSEMAEMTGNDAGRRNFVSASALFLLACATRVISRTYDFDGGLAPLEDKKAPNRETPIIPPGADNVRHFRRHCTGCQLCVSACPNQVLRPSSKLSSFMQPQMSFERGYCRPECVKCGQVCPTSAIRPVTTAEKSSIQIGYAVWNKDLCVVNVDNVKCDLCSRKCPVGAITQIPKTDEENSLKIPMIITNRCIGCGACEHLCPARPYSAIYVEGAESHRVI